jgi:hypothetical protein
MHEHNMILISARGREAGNTDNNLVLFLHYMRWRYHCIHRHRHHHIHPCIALSTIGALSLPGWPDDEKDIAKG